MRKFLLVAAALALVPASLGMSAVTKGNKAAHKSKRKPMQTSIKAKTPAVLNFKMKSLAGRDVNLAKYAGKVVLIVNTASKCGFTRQYAGLQELHKRYAKKGLAVLGFPANDFGQQEPGSNTEIAGFCRANYGVEFAMFSKIAVTGENKAPLYRYLTSEKTNPQFSGEVGWNFEKFLIGRNGKIVARYKSNVEPTSEELVKAIEAQLARK